MINALLCTGQGSKESTGTEEEDSSSEEEADGIESEVIADPGTGENVDHKAKETEAGAEISALVNYVQPVHFSTFENAESN